MAARYPYGQGPGTSSPAYPTANPDDSFNGQRAAANVFGFLFIFGALFLPMASVSNGSVVTSLWLSEIDEGLLVTGIGVLAGITAIFGLIRLTGGLCLIGLGVGLYLTVFPKNFIPNPYVLSASNPLWLAAFLVGLGLFCYTAFDKYRHEAEYS